MTFTSMGRINQAAPGTPVPLSTDPNKRAAKVFFQSVPGLTGKGYIGARNMNKTTLAGVARILWPNQAGGIADQFWLEASDGRDQINLAEYAVDMDIAGEGLLVSYWIE